MPKRPTVAKPLPKPTPVTQPFWDGTKAHRLVLPKTPEGRFFFYPRPIAPGTAATAVSWGEVSGRGTVYSFTIDRRGTAPAFAAETPYVIAIIQLDEGPLMTSNVVGCAPDEVRIGMAVEAVYEEVNAEITLVKFRPIAP